MVNKVGEPMLGTDAILKPRTALIAYTQLPGFGNPNEVVVRGFTLAFDVATYMKSEKHKIDGGLVPHCDFSDIKNVARCIDDRSGEAAVRHRCYS